MPAALRWLLSLVVLNPICVRLVHNASRRKRHLYIRSGYLAVLILVLILVLLPTQGGAQSYRTLAAEGANAFELVAYLQLLLICILTPVFMAGAIAQESNPRTWDVLLTTPLSATQIVLGNLFGRLFFVIALLFATLPLFAITQYFGGVPGSSVLASYAVSACAALVVGAVAVALSVNRLAGRRAVFAFYIAVVSYLGVTAAIDIPLRAGSPAGPGGVTLFTPLNPFLSLNALLAPSSYQTPDSLVLAQMGTLGRFWFGSPVAAFCTVSSVVAVVLALGSSVTARSVSASTGTPWYRKVFGIGAKDAETRPARDVWQNPIAWREAAARANTLPKVVLRWAFIIVGMSFGVGLTIAYHTTTLSVEAYRFAMLATVFTELAVITLIAINMSATAISREREDGTLDLLLTTPLSQAYYLNGKLRGLISYLLPLLAVPVVTMAAGAVYVLLGGFDRPGGVMSSDMPLGMASAVSTPAVLPEAALLLPLATIPFLAFVIMIGLQWSLKSRGTISSVVATVALVGVIAGVVGLCAWNAGSEIQVVGPGLVGLNPFTLVYALTSPAYALESTVSAAGLASARFGLAIGAGVAVVIYAALVFSFRSAMIKTFDVTTRKLAGSR
jgi:ABC-type transport system involved in multi-copper enzyme maturation permease subunit